MPTIIAYIDTDLDHLNCNFLLKIPNKEGNIQTHYQAMRDFAYQMQGSRVNRNQIMKLDQVNKEISSSDLLFYTSTRGEGFGNSFIQAWMRGVPTIALESDPDGIIEREHIGHCSRNFSHLVEHTRELMADPMLLREMGQRARDYAVANHDREHMISRYEAMFRELHERKSA